MTIGGLKKLLKLNLSNNSLTGALPESLCSLSELKQLYLDHNYLQGIAHSVTSFAMYVQ